MHTNILIITLEIFYFGEGSDHLELSVSLHRGCRLPPLQSVSNLRNTAEGSKKELFFLRLKNLLLIFGIVPAIPRTETWGKEKGHVTGS